MRTKKLWGLFWTNFSLATAITTSYFTYTNHNSLSRLLNNVLYKDIVISENYFKDRNGLMVDRTINNSGEAEVYLLHKPSGERYPIMSDMMPPTEMMFNSIEQRIGNFSKDDAIKYLGTINNLERQLHERLRF